MNGWRHWLHALVIAAAGLLIAPAASADGSEQRTPEAVIHAAVDELKTLVAGETGDLDSAEFRSRIGVALTPYVDVPLMAQLAVGKHWRAADADQRERLIAEYRNLLVATYSVPLKALRESRVTVRPLGGDADGSRAKVRVDVDQAAGAPVALVFSLYEKEKRWLIYDVSVEGVSLTTNYRSEFASVIQQRGMDGLIAQLADNNARRRTGTL